MKIRGVGLLLVMTAALTVWACSTNNPARPSMSFVAPSAQTPANGVTFNFNQQPVTLQIANVVRTGAGAVTYSLEVSTANTFASTAVTRDGIAEGSGGTTAVVLPSLNGNTTYYWRWRAIVDGITGEPSATQSFFVRPNIVINIPVLQTPATGIEIFAPKPTFVVTNVTRTGPVGVITYDFQVSLSATFATLLASPTVTEQSGSTTSWTPTADLPEGTIFWRVRAKDVANAVTGSFSNALQFQRKFGIDLSKVVVAFGPPSIVTWKETAKLYNVYFDPNDTETLCTEYDSPGWPETDFILAPPEEHATVAANQWVFVNRGGTWYAGVSAWMRTTAQFCKRDYDQEFFINSLGNTFPFGPAHGTVLHTGDVIGVMMSTPARLWPEIQTRDERSNVVLVPWPAGR